MAIALDTTSSATDTGAVNSLSWSHVCTGSSLILIVSVVTGNSAPLSGVTYNGVAFTQLSLLQLNGGTRYLSTFYLLNPATGSHTIVATNSSTGDMYGTAVSYTGVAGIDSSGNNVANDPGSATNPTLTGTMSTINANSQMIMCIGNNTGTPMTAKVSTPGNAGYSVNRISIASSAGIAIFDKGSDVLAASTSYNMQINFNSTPSPCCYQIFTIQPELGTRYWVGGTGTWDNSTTTHWAQSSGGTAGVSPPLTQPVFIDGSSGGGTVTLGANIACGNLTTTGFSGTLAQSTFTLTLTGNMTLSALTYSGSGALSLTGNLTLNSGMTLSYAGAITFASTATGKTITTAGKTILSVVTFNGVGGGWTLQDTFTCTGASITLTNGSLNLGNQNVSVPIFSSSNSNTRVLTMGSGTITLTGTGTVWDTGTSLGMTLTANTSMINLTNSSASAKTFAGGNLTYRNLTLTSGSTGTYTISGENTFNNFYFTGSGTGTLTISGNNTYVDFKIDTPPHTVLFGAGKRQSVQTFTVSGTAGNLITLHSTVNGTQWFLYKSIAGNIVCDYLSLKDSFAQSTS